MIPKITYALLLLVHLHRVAWCADTPFPEIYNSEPDKTAQPPAAEEALKMFDLPKGFTANLFASEPEVQNPIAMTWDSRGRLWIKECDINPLLASPEKLIALDARIILHEPETKPEDLPRPAIRPYPIEYVEEWTLKDQTPVVIRPIRPEDEPMIVQFHKDLSQETVRQRYLKIVHYGERVAHSRLVRICFNDYDREIALVAERKGTKEILGVMRLSKVPGTEDAAFALVIKDKWQNKGLGSKLMEKILYVAKKEKIERIGIQMLEENFQMQKLCKRHGFRLEAKEGFLFGEINLK